MKKFKIAFLVVGLVFFAFLIYEVGPSMILESFSKVGWRFLIIFAVWFLNYTFMNFAWAVEMRKTFRDIGFFSLYKARIAGEAMNGLIPLGNFGGEPIKVYLLQSKATRSEIVASVVLDKTIFGLGSLVFIFAGLLMAIFYLDVFSFRLDIILTLLLALMVWGLVKFIRKRDFFVSFFKLLNRFGIASSFFEKKVDSIRRMDERIASFYRINKRRFALSVLFHFLGRIACTLEFYLVFKYLGYDLSFAYAFCINSLSLIINAIFFFMPGHWGVAEGAQGFIFLVFKLVAADGIAVGIVRRVRHIFWTSVGLLIFFFSDPRTKEEAMKQIMTEDPQKEELEA